jgi:hypothetical protein
LHPLELTLGSAAASTNTVYHIDIPWLGSYKIYSYKRIQILETKAPTQGRRGGATIYEQLGGKLKLDAEPLKSTDEDSLIDGWMAMVPLISSQAHAPTSRLQKTHSGLQVQKSAN